MVDHKGNFSVQALTLLFGWLPLSWQLVEVVEQTHNQVCLFCVWSTYSGSTLSLRLSPTDLCHFQCLEAFSSWSCTLCFKCDTGQLNTFTIHLTSINKKKQKYHQRNNYFALFMFSLLSFLNPLHLTYWYVLYWCYCDLAFQSWIVQLSFDVAALILSNSMGDHVYVLIKEIQTPTKFPSSSEFGQIESI